MSTGVVGSKIIFSGGQVYIPRKEKDTSLTQGGVRFSPSKEVFVFETDPSIDPNPRLHPSPVYNTSRRPDPDPVLVEVDGKLYRFGGICDCESFEVFDPTQGKWLPRRYPYGFTHAIAGTKILLWGRNQTGAYVFDVTYPEKGWTELDSCLGDCIPYVDGYHELFVKLKFHHGEGDGFLTFSCNMEQSQTVRVFHMSHKCDSLKPMEPLQLPSFTCHEIVET